MGLSREMKSSPFTSSVTVFFIRASETMPQFTFPPINVVLVLPIIAWLEAPFKKVPSLPMLMVLMALGTLLAAFPGRRRRRPTDPTSAPADRTRALDLISEKSSQ